MRNPFSKRPGVNSHEVLSGSTYLVKTRGLTYDKGVSPWSPVSTVTVGGVKAGDASLLSLFILPGELEFDADTTDYTVNVLQGVTGVTVYAFPTNYRATATMDGVLAGPERSVQISLVQGEDKAIPVVVTAEDGVTTKTYTVAVVQFAVTTEEEQDPPGEGSGNQSPGDCEKDNADDP